MKPQKNTFSLLPPNITVFEFDSLPSTNEFLLSDTTHAPVLCIAHHQTKGKGQFGRTWVSEQQSALFSLKLPYEDMSVLSGLSLVVGLAISELLQQQYQLTDIAIKWPNDIYRGDKKLAGILIESSAQGITGHCVIGVGLNIQASNSTIASMATSIDTLMLIHELTANILSYNQRFIAQGFAGFISQWQANDYLTRQQKIIEYEGEYYTAHGVTTEGYLQLRGENATKVLTSSGNMRIL